MDELKEECGLFGIWSETPSDLARTCYYALYALQHRGQEGAGIAVAADSGIVSRKDAGLVNDVFTSSVLSSFPEATMAISHVRYGTTGINPRLNVQPLVVNHYLGSVAVAHNGNLTNDAQLRKELELNGSIFHTTSDTEVIAYMLVRHRLENLPLHEAVSKLMDDLHGAYSLLVMGRDTLVAARDPWGFRPLCLGSFEGGYVISSETCALDAIGAKFIRDILPGEVVTISNGELKSDTSHCNKEKKHLCVFELIYFARPDSVMDGHSVQTARQRAGAFLALEHPVQADIVIGVPDSGIEAAMGFARQSGIPYGTGFIKNKYIGRTFIQPTQSMRENEVRIKLNPIASAVRGKRVVLIDDSIVRGTTSIRIVRLLREAGAREVHFRSSAPKFLYPCYFGTDIESSENLFAYKYTDEEMKRLLDVDSLGFLSVENVVRLTEDGDHDFCTACFSRDYPCPPPKVTKKDKFSMPVSGKG